MPSPNYHAFASDNGSGICPEAWAALEQVNTDYTPAYGEDDYTKAASDAIREFFEVDCEVFFVFNGTAANSLALASLCKSYHSVLCHERAHVETDECGAPEFFSNGTKILTVDGEGGKVSLDALEHQITRRSDIHYPKPQVISVTQSTEVGTIYTPDELQAVGRLARKYELLVHMDGSRLSNAIASLDVAPKAATWETGVDVLCMGGTKAGLPFGEAVVFFKKELAEEFGYRCKQAGQLASKMRFLSAPFLGVLESGAYLRHATHANAMADRLAEGLAMIKGVRLQYSREANAVFAQLPDALATALRDTGWHFYTFIGSDGARFVCNWNTSTEDVDTLLADAASESL
jgi:threonine aldolase